MRLQTSLGIAIGTAVGTLVAAKALRSRRAIDFAGKTVVIFGGSRGLGLAMAREFSRAGAYVVLTARDEQELERAAADIERARRPGHHDRVRHHRSRADRAHDRTHRPRPRRHRRARQQRRHHPGRPARAHDRRRLRRGDGDALLGAALHDPRGAAVHARGRAPGASSTSRRSAARSPCRTCCRTAPASSR